MNIPKIIHFTIPKSPSADQLKAIEVARELHPGWKIEVWQDPLDRGAFRLSKYWEKTNSGAQLADLIRLEVVLLHGGFYLDSDIMLRKSLDALRVYPFVIASEDGKVLTNAFFGAVPQSPVVQHLVETLDNHEIDWTLEPYLSTGPAFFARELKWRDDVTVLPRETFYPYNWHQKPTSPRAGPTARIFGAIRGVRSRANASQFVPSSAVAGADLTPFVTNFSLIIGIHCTVGARCSGSVVQSVTPLKILSALKPSTDLRCISQEKTDQLRQTLHCRAPMNSAKKCL